MKVLNLRRTKSSVVMGPLERYYRILSGEGEASYLISKRRSVDVDLAQDDAHLWQMHERVVRGIQKPGSAVSLLDIKIELAKRMMSHCSLCERRCLVDRAKGEAGHCRVLSPKICSDFLHMGEEPDLVQSYTIFFSGCTLECAYCQNWDISTHPELGAGFESAAVAKMIEARACARGGRESQARLTTRARNVNWVGGDPTPNLPFILETLGYCEANLPQVWNSNMYLSERAMDLLNGIVDLYLTDFKYGNDACAKRLSNAPDYLRIVRRNHILAHESAEMIVRHLVLPGHVECCTRPVLEWVSKNLEHIKVNVMSQYRPEHRAMQFPEISRPLGMEEFKRAIQIAEDLGVDLTD